MSLLELLLSGNRYWFHFEERKHAMPTLEVKLGLEENFSCFFYNLSWIRKYRHDIRRKISMILVTMVWLLKTLSPIFPGFETRQITLKRSWGEHLISRLTNLLIINTREFFLLGIICGLAIYNDNIVDLRFPLALYKKLLYKEPTIEDLDELKPSVGKSMHQVLDAVEADCIEGIC